jgi:hypothetical protein
MPNPASHYCFKTVLTSNERETEEFCSRILCDILVARWFSSDRKENPGLASIRSVFRAAKSAHGVDDQAHHQNQANPAAAKNRAAKVKAAATEQEQQNHDDQLHIHTAKITSRRTVAMGSSPHVRF